jgi:hypothetical protein
VAADVKPEKTICMSYKIIRRRGLEIAGDALLRGNKPDRFTANFWRLNLPKRDRMFLCHRPVIMARQSIATILSVTLSV